MGLRPGKCVRWLLLDVSSLFHGAHAQIPSFASYLHALTLCTCPFSASACSIPRFSGLFYATSTDEGLLHVMQCLAVTFSTWQGCKHIILQMIYYRKGK
eukprot:1140685-Pelagomonas_calceolata.AAC.1